ncbi:MAG: DUF6941 family protein [Pseudomonadota bacterium]
MISSSKQPTLVDFLICDDIRQEADGRFSLMGVYPSSTISAPQLPTIVPQMALVFRLRGLTEPRSIDLTIEAPDGHQTRTAPLRNLTPSTKTGEALFFVQAAPIQLSIPGDHEVRLRLGRDHEETACFHVKQPA